MPDDSTCTNAACFAHRESLEEALRLARERMRKLESAMKLATADAQNVRAERDRLRREYSAAVSAGSPAVHPLEAESA